VCVARRNRRWVAVSCPRFCRRCAGCCRQVRSIPNCMHNALLRRIVLFLPGAIEQVALSLVHMLKVSSHPVPAKYPQLLASRIKKCGKVPPVGGGGLTLDAQYWCILHLYVCISD
jgi:hypothetical protein